MQVRAFVGGHLFGERKFVFGKPLKTWFDTLYGQALAKSLSSIAIASDPSLVGGRVKSICHGVPATSGVENV